MIKFPIYNRYTGSVKFTAEIDCDESASQSWKLRLAILAAIKVRYDLTRADLSGADLTDADLTRADLTRADLSWADLTRARLTGACLTRARLTDACLTDANLIGADLTRADLTRSRLTGANLKWATGNNKELKTVHSGKYHIAFTSSVMAIGCQQHTIKQWWRFTKKQIAAMDRGALEWWTTWKPILKSIIEAQDA